MTIEKLVEKTSTYLGPKDVETIKKAYELALSVHENKKRGTGEDYIDHPLEVAYYLAENDLDTPTIVAAILHDTEEEKPEIKNTIRKEFGQEVADLVEGVTKLGKIKIKRSWFFPLSILQARQQKELGFERHVESLRKMLLAMTKDIRVVLIKFADRLHNMKTLKGVRPEKRERIARETLEIYSPLAYRLGMGKIKGELEDLAFPYAYPKEYAELKKILGHKFEEKEKYLKKVMTILGEKLKKEHIKAELHGRRKHLYSLYKKLLRLDNNLNKIYDLVAIRIIVPNVEECYQTLGIIHAMWKPLIGRIKDYIALPKPNGYQSLHTTVFGPDGEIVEIQIRTHQMHEKAENGVAAHWHYSDKKHSGNAKIAPIGKDQTEWLNELKRWQEGLKDARELNEALKLDFFRDRIFVFTPGGDVSDLPINACPIDFAYSIHTEVGQACQGARVNGKMVKLDYPLKNGDIVDIITKKSSKPKRDWLKFVKTSRAKGKIRSFFEQG